MPKISCGPLEGSGVRLRLLAEDDLPATLAWRNDPEVRRWFVHSAPISEEQHRGWFASYQQKADDLTFAIEETDVLRRPVGQAALYRIDELRRTCEFGRLMIGDRRRRGKGIAKRAVDLLIAFAFESLDVERIELEVFSDNVRARTLYEQIGFVAAETTGPMVAMNLDRARSTIRTGRHEEKAA